MLPEDVSQFISQNHNAVPTTFRRNSMPQMSIVTVGAYGEGTGFTTTEDRAKLHNLARDPRCSLLISKSDWWGYVVLEGRARVLRRGHADDSELAEALRGIYRAASGTEHPNWEEYDQSMIDDRRAAIIVVPDHVYGTAL